ncbi:MAG: PQQ-binding-like beta-propeller repeat protein [Bdellovibrionia bacterium]
MQVALALLILIASFTSGCASWKGSVRNPEPELSRTWVRSTLQQENLSFRKINRARPILIDNLVIQANGMDGIKAYDRTTGASQWQFLVENGVESSPAVIRDRLFFAGNDGVVYSVDGKTGDLVWKFETKFENLGEPRLHDGVLYFITGANVVFALDASNGKQLWVFAKQDTSNFSVRGGARPTFYKDLVYVGFSDGSVVALGNKTGAIKWEVLLNRNKRFRDIDANLILDNDQLLVAGFDDKLYALAPNTGEMKWKLDGGSYSGPSISDKLIFYPTTQKEVWALDRKTGQRIWTFKDVRGLASEIAVFDKFISFGESQGGIVLLDMESGKFIDRFEPGRGVLSPLSVDPAKNEIYFVSGEANLYKINVRSNNGSDWPIVNR